MDLGLDMKWAGVAKFFGPTIYIYIYIYIVTIIDIIIKSSITFFSWINLYQYLISIFLL